MTILFKSAEWEQVTVTATTQYNCPSNAKSAVIIFANCTNEDAAGTSVTINVVQSSGSVADTNIYVDAKTIAPDDSDPLSEIVGMVLEPGDSVYALAADASRLNLKISIKEIY